MFLAKVTWQMRVGLECPICSAERERRCCIISTSDRNKDRYVQKPFTDAPYVHPFRFPSGHAQHLRAIAFAKENQQQLLWITAYDKPKKQDDAKFKGERLEQLKEEWLQLPSARTSGIPGLFPLVKDLPVRFTDSPDKQARERGVFKNAKGCLLYTSPSPRDGLLCRMPSCA